MFCAQPAKLLSSSAFRLALVYMALFSTSVLLLLGFIYWSTVGYMERQTDATIAAEITGLGERYDLTGLPGLTSLISERLKRRPAGSSIYLLADANRVALLGNFDRWPQVAPDAEGWLNFRLEDQLGGEGEVHRARARAFVLPGGFHLLVGRDLHELQQVQRRIGETLAWGMGITLVLAFLGGIMMSRSTSRRIETINAACRDIIYGDLSRRIPSKGSGDDFDQLVANLNDMLERIEVLMTGVRQVSDNIAHDLRTPLARLRNRLEQLRQEGGTAEGELLDQAVGEADTLLSTFKALLRIGGIEAGSCEAFRKLDAGEILSDVAELYEPLAEEKGLSFEVDLETGAQLQGDRDLLFQAVANLLDNAIKYTPAGGHIALTLTDQADQAVITVADSGPGIPVAQRQKVLQRFYRIESSRTTPGNGLGLSLVEAVSTLHRGQLTFEDNMPGLRVTLALPCEPGLQEKAAKHS